MVLQCSRNNKEKVFKVYVTLKMKFWCWKFWIHRIIEFKKFTMWKHISCSFIDESNQVSTNWGQQNCKTFIRNKFWLYVLKGLRCKVSVDLLSKDARLPSSRNNKTIESEKVKKNGIIKTYLGDHKNPQRRAATKSVAARLLQRYSEH